MKLHRALLVAGIIGPLVTIILTTVDTAISPWFTWEGNALSDLGVHPYSYLFNYSLIFEAAMNIVFVIGLTKVHSIRRSTAVLLAISGLSLGMVGIFVETYHLYHLTFALVYFIFFPVSIILFGRDVRKNYPRQAAIGYVIAAISLLDIIIGIAIDFSAIPGLNMGIAIPEMVEAVLLGGWSAYIAVWSLSISGLHKTKTNEDAAPD